MKPLLFFLLLSQLSLTTFAQHRVQGSVKDPTGKDLPFVSIALLHAKDSSLAKGAVTTEQGSYRFENVPNGRYVIAASSVAYQKQKSGVFDVAADVTVPALTLTEASRTLNEVTVNAQKPLYEQQIDRMVINVQSSIMAAGSTALDVLERSPGVTVDRSNKVLSMNGKQGVMVMLNGKLSRIPLTSLIQMLGSMNAGNIEKIELITTPPAQYDAEGNAGLINIVTKRSPDLGTNGSWSANFGYGRWERAGMSGNINRRTEKLSLFADYSGQMNHVIRLYDSYRLISQPVPVRTDITIRRDERDWIHNGQAGLEWNLSRRTSFSSLLTLYNFQSNQYCSNTASVTREGQPFTQTYIDDDELNDTWVYTGNVNLRHTLKKGEISADIDFIRFFNNNPHRYQFDTDYLQEGRTTSELVRNEKRTPIRLWVAKADYSLNLNEAFKLSLGAKSTLAHFDNKIRFENLRENSWLIDSSLSQHVQMNETIWAGYVNLNGKLTPKDVVQAGLRYEHTQTDLRTIEGTPLVYRNYGNWFPTVYWMRTLSPSSSFRLAYSQRISRPSFGQLAPFLYFVDPTTSGGGNERLLPTLATNIQASYRFKKNYQLTVEHTWFNHPISYNTIVIPAENRQITSPENLDQARNLSVSFSFPLAVTKWWQMQTSLLSVRQANQFTQEGITRRQQQIFGRLTSTQTFMLPSGFSAEVSGFYQSRTLIGVMVRRPFGVLNLGVKKQLPNHKGSLRLSGEDVFWTNYAVIDVSNPAQGYSVHSGGRGYHNRLLRLTYTRTFGNQKIKVNSSRVTGSDDERRRVNN
ncbi:outer membrane beta-barrel family protein [Nibrella saemangeumensis]|uniref:Outer membrane beta-barrel family protein n=1 Tax=Nibrella saemangeumensis TaxID=1084526 RepID=A0ABP8MW90_9BACT